MGEDVSSSVWHATRHSKSWHGGEKLTIRNGAIADDVNRRCRNTVLTPLMQRGPA